MPRAIKMFSKSLTETDIKKRLAIPVKILPSLPEFNGSHTVTIHLIFGAKVWPIVCSIRKKGYKKPVFSGGWRNFVIGNDFHVGEELTVYKVQDEAGSFHYRAEVEKLAKPSMALSARAELDETTGTSRTIKREGATNELADTAVTTKAIIKPKHEAEMNFFGITIDTGMCKPPLHARHVTKKARDTKALFDLYGSESTGRINLDLVLGQPNLTKEERDIKRPFDLKGGDSLFVYGTSQATEEAYSENTGGLSLELVLEQPSPHKGAVNLDLTLAQPLPILDLLASNHNIRLHPRKK